MCGSGTPPVVGVKLTNAGLVFRTVESGRSRHSAWGLSRTSRWRRRRIHDLRPSTRSCSSASQHDTLPGFLSVHTSARRCRYPDVHSRGPGIVLVEPHQRLARDLLRRLDDLGLHAGERRQVPASEPAFRQSTRYKCQFCHRPCPDVETARRCPRPAVAADAALAVLGDHPVVVLPDGSETQTFITPWSGAR